MVLITRKLEAQIRAQLGKNKAILIMGTRRVGKTVLVDSIKRQYKGDVLVLNAEDFDFNRDSSANSAVKKEIEVKGSKYYLVESDVSSSSPNYSKVISYVSATQYLPIKAECYDKQSKLLKIIDFSDYKKLPGNKYRAGKIKIRNVQNKRGTDIVLSDIKLNQGLKSSKFTPKSLSSDD